MHPNYLSKCTALEYVKVCNSYFRSVLQRTVSVLQVSQILSLSTRATEQCMHCEYRPCWKLKRTRLSLLNATTIFLSLSLIFYTYVGQIRLRMVDLYLRYIGISIRVITSETILFWPSCIGWFRLMQWNSDLRICCLHLRRSILYRFSWESIYRKCFW